MSLFKDKQGKIERLASESLNIIETVASKADSKIKEKSQNSGFSPFATENTWTTGSANNLTRIRKQNIDDLNILAKEPVIARVVAISEDGEEKIYYISRTTPVLVEGIKASFASYRSSVGRLASMPPGEYDDVIISGKPVYREIVERTQYHPKYDNGWDSHNNIVEEKDAGFITIESLRKFLEETPKIKDTKDILSGLLNEETTSENIYEGVRRNVISRMSLRDQPILDKYQDEIFRLPLDSQLLLVGPPGTGKTTTLIRRLGLKLDMEFLSKDEQELLGSFQTTLHHKDNWIMFTPTELLKQYVKEAFNREGIPAPEERIKTWDDYRHDLARNTLGILKAGTGTGIFILNDSKSCLNESAFNNNIEWYEQFAHFYYSQLMMQLKESTEWLINNADDYNIVNLANKVKRIFGETKDEISVGMIQSLDRLSDDISALLRSYQSKTTEIIRDSLNSLLNTNSSFLDKLAEYCEKIQQDTTSEGVDGDDDDDDSDMEELPSASIPRRENAYREYSVALRSLARAKKSNKKLASATKAAEIIAWLDDKLISEDDLATIGDNMMIQARLRHLANPIKMYVNRVPRLYRSFRKECVKSGHWYIKDSLIPSQVDCHEVDVILLLMLRNINALIKNYNYSEIIGTPKLQVLQAVGEELRNQVLIDEATDFSPIQLACMMELSNSRVKSFFACGDFNQRITSWGTKKKDHMLWVSPSFDVRSISVSYRQSKQLNEIAKKIAKIESGSEVVLPDYADIEGVPPVLAEDMDGLEKLTLWLKDRINEIEKGVQTLPSIAIFVDEESKVESTADALNEQLIDNNIRVVSCPHGRVMGQDGDIRVFNIQHIKGLEFEAVFFLGVDRLAMRVPDLFDKFLYVGITRAATYLGITCEQQLPEKIDHIRELFDKNWSGQL